MMSGFGIDHGEVAKAFKFPKIGGKLKPKAPASSYTPPWEKPGGARATMKPTPQGLRNAGDASATPGAKLKAGGGSSTFQSPAKARNPKKPPTAYPARRSGF